jgi:carbonic anhydrase
MVDTSGMIESQPSRRSFLTSSLVAGGTLLAAPNAYASHREAPAAPRPSTPDEALAKLKAGNERFQKGRSTAPRVSTVRRAEIAEGQDPFAVVLGCADSRVPPELVFDQGLGDLFTVRVAGNTAAASVVVGSVEYATAVLDTPLVVVLGHDDCGAVKAAIDVVTKGKQLPGELSGFVDPIVPAVQAVVNTPPAQLLDAAVAQNIRQTVAALSAQPLLATDIASGKVKVVGAEYRLHSGKVDLIS